MDSKNYTIANPDETKWVKVAELRNVIEHLERLVNCDYHSCSGASELANWASSARRIGAELITLQSKRATASDMDRRERAIERSTSLLGKVAPARVLDPK